jgi:hypothetical protein
MLVTHWGSKLGLQVLRSLSSLYMSLVWESSVLIALCSDNVFPSDCQFGAADIARIMSRAEAKPVRSTSDKDPSASPQRRAAHDTDVDSLLVGSRSELNCSDTVSAAMESLTTSETASSSTTPMEIELGTGAVGTTCGKHSHLIQVKIKRIFKVGYN